MGRCRAASSRRRMRHPSIKGQGGDGTGPVRRETLRLLRDDAGVRQYVDSFWVAPPDRGGEGAAQVNLRP